MVAAYSYATHIFCCFRVQAYIINGWAKNVVDPDRHTDETPSAPTGSASTDAIAILGQSWQNIRTMYKSPSDIPQFSNAQIVSYFVTRTVSDGIASSDFKSINQSALHLFRCGHVQSIEVMADKTKLLMRGECLQEMRKDRIYKLN